MMLTVMGGKEGQQITPYCRLNFISLKPAGTFLNAKLHNFKLSPSYLTLIITFLLLHNQYF